MLFSRPKLELPLASASFDAPFQASLAPFWPWVALSALAFRSLSANASTELSWGVVISFPRVALACWEVPAQEALKKAAVSSSHFISLLRSRIWGGTDQSLCWTSVPPRASTYPSLPSLGRFWAVDAFRRRLDSYFICQLAQLQGSSLLFWHTQYGRKSYICCADTRCRLRFFFHRWCIGGRISWYQSCSFSQASWASLTALGSTWRTKDAPIRTKSR